MKKKTFLFVSAILIASTTLFAQKASDFIQAAQSGNAKAQDSLGICYEKGLGIGINYIEAVKWYKLAAEQGLADAQHNLGVCYLLGHGVEEDYIQAVKLWRMSANQGYVQDMYNLGVCYKDGIGVERNEKEAIKWYTLAAQQGNKYAKRTLEDLAQNRY